MSDQADVWRDLVDRAHHLAMCIFKAETKADIERARHNAAVLANAISHAQQNERNNAIAAKTESVDAARDGTNPSADLHTSSSVERMREALWNLTTKMGAQKAVTGKEFSIAVEVALRSAKAALLSLSRGREGERVVLRKRPVAWMRYVCGDCQFQHASDEGDPPEDQGWIALYRRGEHPRTSTGYGSRN